ncbi:MAG: hypothetical protein RJB66_546 [Pseudomonadota bacterium]|jgi:deoxyribodipyrimidine photo-lyase
MKQKRCLLWFTKDLRIHDNQLINWAVNANCEVLAIGFASTEKSVFANNFYNQSLLELRDRFRNQGVPFFILDGSPIDQIPQWVANNHIDYLVTQAPFNSREQVTLNGLTSRLDQIQVISIYQQTLLDFEHLPFSVAELPLVFTDFRKDVERQPPIQSPKPSELHSLQGFEALKPNDSLIYDEVINPPQIEWPFDLIPGEESALKRVHEYFWETQSISTYKETRNGLLNKNDSSKISPYLALGALSPRLLFYELKKFEEIHGANESTRWFFYELLWRDYFKFLALEIGPKLFSPNGLSTPTKTWLSDTEILNSWKNGETKVNFVDANMRELKLTGWMSNRGRQNVASYLAKHINLDWTLGARHFEQNLIDDDTESNWGNWLYLAGVGTDPRNRHFNIQRQQDLYDPNGDYCNRWLPPASLR